MSTHFPFVFLSNLCLLLYKNRSITREWKNKTIKRIKVSWVLNLRYVRGLIKSYGKRRGSGRLFRSNSAARTPCQAKHTAMLTLSFSCSGIFSNLFAFKFGATSKGKQILKSEHTRLRPVSKVFPQWLAAPYCYDEERMLLKRSEKNFPRSSAITLVH